LSFIENFGAIIKALSTEHQASMLASLQSLHHVLQYEILTFLDDTEIKLGLQPGILNKKYSLTPMIDRAFDQLIIPNPQTGETLQPFLNFFADQEVTTWRANRLEQQLNQLGNKSEQFFLDIENQQLNIEAALDKLNILDTQLSHHFNQQKNWDYSESTQHKKDFCACYEVLQPYLSQINPALYTKATGFFDLLTTPQQLTTQIKNLLALQPKLNELLENQKRDFNAQYERTEQHLNDINHHQSNQHQRYLLEQCIKKILEKNHPLNEYTPLFIKTITPMVLKKTKIPHF